MNMNFKTEYSFLTHKGRVRKKNEDSILVSREFDLAAVADGMGGHSSGDIASKIAVKTIKQVVSDIENKNIPTSNLKLDLSRNTDKLLLACRLANKKILEKASKNPQNKGMGTTLSAMLLRKNKAYTIHIGDSRIYLLRKNTLSQLTCDHSLAAEQFGKGVITKDEARNSAMQNVLTKALGITKYPKFDISETKVLAGDILLLCSDGLSKTLENKQIARILTQKKPIQKICRTLVNRANAKGGPDNISVVLIKLNPPPLSEKIKQSVKLFFTGVRNERKTSFFGFPLMKLCHK